MITTKPNPSNGGSGEINTASNAGSGLSLFYQKNGVDLEFNGIKSENSLLTVNLDAVTHDVELTVVESNIDHSNILNTHNLTTDINHDTLLNGHNLSTDIDHNGLTNTHNLTTDINHNSIANTHNLTTDIDHTAISNIGTNSHSDIDTHIADNTVHFTIASLNLSDYIKKDGTDQLTANWDAGNYRITASTFSSDVAISTAPLTVVSTTLVANLNCDLLDGQEGAYYLNRTNHTGTQSADTIVDGITNAIPTLTQESNWDLAYGWGDHSLIGYLVNSNNLSDVSDRQTAIDNLTNVSAATNEHVLTKDTATGNAIFKAVPGGGGGEANTASNAGSGSSLFYQKSGVDLQFNGIKSENSLLDVSVDSGSHDVELTVNEGNINHNNLSNIENLVHDISEASYMEVTRTSGLVTNITYWTDSGKTVKIREIDITRTNGLVSSVIRKQYISGVLDSTETNTITRTNDIITSVEQVIT